jgi:electron transfer flavoprotein alpha subunit
MILVIAEQQNNKLNRASWETIAAAQQMPGALPVKVAVMGAQAEGAAAELAGADVSEVLRVENPALDPYTADGFVEALQALVSRQAPTYVLLSNTYRTRDFAPRVAARLDRALIPDCVGIKTVDQKPTFVRLLFQGRLAADVVPEGDPPYFVTFQITAFRADAVVRRAPAAPVTRIEVPIDTAAIRQRPEEPFKGAKQGVDLTQAERIVSVGRGIKAREHMDLAQKLATVLGAELGASRPICDAGWAPMELQIGSSGQTVAPRLYFALGISGAIQHVIGMKSARTIVAVNKDPDAPIFKVANFGIVGDLFEIVPAVIAELTG